jgi:hypothetical protein
MTSYDRTFIIRDMRVVRIGNRSFRGEVCVETGTRLKFLSARSFQIVLKKN